jgi:hypothetical protein
MYAEFVGECCGKLLLAEAGTTSESLERVPFSWLLGPLPPVSVLA